METHVIDAMQDWGSSPSWEAKLHHPHSVALQSRDDDDTYEITIIEYNDYGDIVDRKLVATCSRNQLRMSGKLPDYGIYDIPKA